MSLQKKLDIYLILLDSLVFYGIIQFDLEKSGDNTSPAGSSLKSKYRLLFPASLRENN
jgi:hypothetical protein